jgi:hypothetical protein
MPTSTISPERTQIARVFKNHIDRAIAELGSGYQVDIQGTFDKTPIKIVIEVTSKDGIP